MNEIDTNALKAHVQTALTKSGCLSLEGFYVNKLCPVLDDFQGGTDATKESLATAVSNFAPGIDERSVLCLYDAPVSGHPALDESAAATVSTTGELVQTEKARVVVIETGVVPYERIVITLDGVACRRHLEDCIVYDELDPLRDLFHAMRDVSRLVRHAFCKKTHTWCWNDIRSINDGWPRGKLCINGTEIVTLNGHARNVLILLQDLRQILRK